MLHLVWQRDYLVSNKRLKLLCFSIKLLTIYFEMSRHNILRIAFQTLAHMECSQISVYFKISGFSKMNRIDWTSDKLVGPLLNMISLWTSLFISSMCTDIEEEVKSKYILHWSYRQYTAVPEELEHHGTHIEEIYLRENSILILVS